MSILFQICFTRQLYGRFLEKLQENNELYGVFFINLTLPV